MSEYIEVKFKGRRTQVFINPQQFPFKIGDYAVVETEKGIDLGRVNNISPKFKPVESKNGRFHKVLRKSLPEDFKSYAQNKINEKKALDICKQRVDKHKLAMKLVDCEYQFDNNKITFYFTADKRVDFRNLVKDLAGEYKTRIELRQIGVRDEAKHLAGYGVCGRQLCCSLWINDFSPVTTQAAKDQNLPLNPNKLAGVCGRLKCCLMYERDFYNWAIKQYPELAKEIKTEKGRGIVVRIDVLKESVLVKYPSDDTYETLPLSEIKDKIYKCQDDCGHEHGNLENLGGEEE
ncbi:MAG: stage 0 sporulation family protein [bacterium]